MLLAYLFNYISGRLQPSRKSGLCFYRLLEFSTFFDPAIFDSIQLFNTEQIQSPPPKPVPALLVNSPGTEWYIKTFLLVFSFWTLHYSLPQFLNTHPDVWKVVLITECRAIYIKRLHVWPYLISALLNALPALLYSGGRSAHTGPPHFDQSCALISFITICFSCHGQNPHHHLISPSVLNNLEGWPAEISRSKCKKQKKSQTWTSLMGWNILWQYLRCFSPAIHWTDSLSGNIKGCYHIMCTNFMLTIISVFQRN